MPGGGAEVSPGGVQAGEEGAGVRQEGIGPEVHLEGAGAGVRQEGVGPKVRLEGAGVGVRTGDTGALTGVPWREKRAARSRRTYSRSQRRARASRRSRSRESKRRSRSGDRMSKSPGKVRDLREKLKEEAQKKEMAELRRQFKIVQDSHKEDYNHMKFALPGGGNKEQMRFVRDVKQIMIYDLKAMLAQEFNEKVPPVFLAIVDKGEQLMKFRMKIIAFAEESTFGWKAANEFAMLLKSSNDIDLKKQEEAEKRALKKIEGEKKAKWKKAGVYEKATVVEEHQGGKEEQEQVTE